MKTNFNSYRLGIVTYYLSIFFFILTFLIIFFNFLFNLNINSIIYSNNEIFKTSITILSIFIPIQFGLLGFIQTTINNYQYNINSFSKYIRPFIFLFGLIILILFYNIIFLYLDLGILFEVGSFILVLSLVFNFVSFLFLSNYLTKKNNVMDYITNDIIYFIQNGEYKKEIILPIQNTKSFTMPNKEYQYEIIEQYNILVSNLFQTIKNNEIIVMKNILINLNKITKSYLLKTQELELNLDDEFIKNLNDQNEFIFETLVKDEKYQKYLELFVKTTWIDISNILEYYKNPFPTRNDLALGLVTNLENYFYKCFKLKRTVVCPHIIKVIGSTTIKSIQKGYIESVSLYDDKLNNILKILKHLKQPENQFWSSQQIRNIIEYKRKILSCYLANLYPNKHFKQFFLKKLFETLFSNLIEIKKEFNYQNNSIILLMFYGVPSFLSQIRNSVILRNLNHDKNLILNTNLKKEIKLFLMELIKYNSLYLENKIENNVINYNHFYSELIYYVLFEVDLDLETKKELIKNIFEKQFNLMLIYLENENSNFNDLAEGFLVSLIFILNQENKYSELYNEITNLIISFFSKSIFNNKYNSRIRYNILKNIGCWNYSILGNNHLTSKKITELIIKKNFKFEEYRGKAHITSNLQKYNYFRTYFSENSFNIFPSDMWGVTNQRILNQFINGDESCYEKYHNYLDKKINKKKEKSNI